MIMLDLEMPFMNGFEFLTLLKAQPSFATIPVVVLTTSEYNGDLSQSYALGANSCITKPGEFEKLVDIARAVGGYWCRINRVQERK